MQNLLNNIYSIDNIITYIIIAIVALVILFVIILIFGKKDQKLEETKRLELMNKELEKTSTDAFKEEKEQPIKLESEDIKEKYPEILLPPTNNEVSNTKEPIKEVSLNDDTEPVSEPTVSIPFEAINDTPILKKQEEKPLIFVNEPVNEEPKKEITIEEPKTVNVVEFTPKEEPKAPLISVIDDEPEPKEQVKEEIPEFNFDEIKPEIDKAVEPKKEHYERQSTGYEGTLPRPQIFSSVYVEKKEETPEVIEIKDEPKEQVEDDFELPQLKTKEEKPQPEPTFSFESLNGEKYKINR